MNNWLISIEVSTLEINFGHGLSGTSSALKDHLAFGKIIQAYQLLHTILPIILRSEDIRDGDCETVFLIVV